MHTINDWISDYDNGNEIESVCLGGMGAGYECAIQDCAIEILRQLSSKEVPEVIEEFRKEFESASDLAVKLLNNFHGFSGAQVGAAKNMAAIFWRQTPAVGLDKMRDSSPDRIIKIKKGQNGHPEIASGDVGE